MGSEAVRYLDTEDLLTIGQKLVGRDFVVRDMGLLGSAAERPRASAFGEDAYRDIWTKAAALMQSLVNSHPLVDGNKRLGWLATAVFLDLNGVDVTTATNDDVYDLVIAVAGGSPTVEGISADLQRICASV